jgi:hypothetical protein
MHHNAGETAMSVTFLLLLLTAGILGLLVGGARGRPYSWLMMSAASTHQVDHAVGK